MEIGLGIDFKISYCSLKTITALVFSEMKKLTSFLKKFQSKNFILSHQLVPKEILIPLQIGTKLSMKKFENVMKYWYRKEIF